MHKKYYEPYEQMYRKVDEETQASDNQPAQSPEIPSQKIREEDISGNTVSDTDSKILKNDIQGLNLPSVFKNIEIEDIIIIAIIVLLFMSEEENDWPLLLILGFVLLADKF